MKLHITVYIILFYLLAVAVAFIEPYFLPETVTYYIYANIIEVTLFVCGILWGYNLKCAERKTPN